MFANLIIGTVLMVINLGIQVLAVAFLVRYFTLRIDSGQMVPTFFNDSKTLSIVMAVLIVGHAFMFATWAGLFVWLGEFEDFATAFYHSTVNFTSLGYGDIVMSEERRLLGALEAANGVLMFGLSAGAILSVMNGLFSRRKAFSALKGAPTRD
jgi:voltage-gated potassium channel Kch